MRRNAFLTIFAVILMILLPFADVIAVNSEAVETSASEQFSPSDPEPPEYDFIIDGLKYKEIGDSKVSVAGCDNLKRIAIPEKVQYDNREYVVADISDNAFWKNGLLGVSISKTVERIGAYAFENCKLMTEVNFDSDSGLKEIGKYAFAGNGVWKMGMENIDVPSSVQLIGEYAFANCVCLRNVNINGRISDLSEGAFSGDTNLKSLTIAEGAGFVNIGDYAFNGCSSLRMSEMSDIIETIGNYAFFGCKSIAITSLGTSVKRIGDHAFYDTSITKINLNKAPLEECIDDQFAIRPLAFPDDCKFEDRSAYDKEHFYYASSSGTLLYSKGSYIAIIRCPADVTVYEDLTTVATIGQYAFYRNAINSISLGPSRICEHAFSESSVKSVDLRGINTVICDYAFSDCKNLSNITLGATIEIGRYAFYNASLLKDVNLKDSSLSKIGEFAFYGTSIEKAEIPKTVNEIGANAFPATCIYVIDSENQTFSSICGALFNKNFSKIIRVPTPISSENVSEIFSKNPEVIGEYAFSEVTFKQPTSVKEYKIDIPESVKTIEDYAFYKVTVERGASTRIVISSPVNVGAYAFSEVRNVNEIDIGVSSAKHVKNDADGTIIKEYAFSRSSEKFRIGIGVVSIGEYAFSNNNINNFKIDDGGNITVDRYAFSSCKFENLKIPSSVKQIGDYAFSNCDSNRYDRAFNLTITGSDTEIGTSILDSSEHIGNIIISGSEIGMHSLSGITMNYLEIKESNIGDYAVCNTNVNGSVKIIGETGGYTIGEYAFQGSSSSSIEISECITSIGGYAFSEASFRTITFKAGVQEIGDHVFYKCTSTEKMTLSKSVTKIGDYAFAESNIPVDFEGYISDIGRYAFYKYACKVGTVDMPSNVKKIGDFAFSETKIRAITGASGLITIGDGAFRNSTELETFALGEELTHIGSQAFFGTKINSFIIGAKVTEIVGGAFPAGSILSVDDVNVCYKLEDNLLFRVDNGKKTAVVQCMSGYFNDTDTFTMPDGIMELCEYALYGIKEMKHVQMNAITSVNAGTFEDSGLTEVTISKSISAVRNDAFRNCKDLSKVTIEYGVEYIGDAAFYDSGMTSVYIPSSIRFVGANAFLCSELTMISMGHGVCLTSESFGTRYQFYDEAGHRKMNYTDVPGFIYEKTGGTSLTTYYTSIKALHWVQYISSPGSNGPECCDVEDGSEYTISFDPIPVWEGNIFLGWAETSGADTPKYEIGKESKVTLKNDLTLYAVWQQPKVLHRISYDPNGGIGPVPKTEYCEKGTEIKMPSYEGRMTGYQFIGWEYDSHTYIPGEKFTVGTADVTFIAQWERMIVEHNVTYDLNGAEGTVPVQGPVAEGSQFTVLNIDEDVKKDGYVFSGWLYDGKSYQPETILTMGTDDVKFTAIWKEDADSFIVSYDKNGGMGVVPDITEYHRGDVITVSNGLTKVGAYFGGWYFYGRIYQPGETVIIGNNDINFKAIWGVYAKHTGQNIESGEDLSIEEECDINLLVAENPYILIWNDGGDMVDVDGYVKTELLSASNGVAKWRFTLSGEVTELLKENKQYIFSLIFRSENENTTTMLCAWFTVSDRPHPGPTQIFLISYDGNGGDGNVPGKVIRNYGDTVIVEQYSGHKDGFEFGGWEYKGITYQPGDEVIVKSNIVFKAVWVPVHSVTYDVSGGTGDVPIQADVVEGGSFTVADYSGHKDGFEFDGWECNGTSYKAGDTVRMGSSDMIFHAVWNEVPASDSVNIGVIIGIIAVAAVLIIGAICFIRRK